MISTYNKSFCFDFKGPLTLEVTIFTAGDEFFLHFFILGKYIISLILREKVTYLASLMVIVCYIKHHLDYFKQFESRSQQTSRNMRIPTMWYVRPAKAQISLRIRAV